MPLCWVPDDFSSSGIFCDGGVWFYMGILPFLTHGLTSNVEVFSSRLRSKGRI